MFKNFRFINSSKGAFLSNRKRCFSSLISPIHDYYKNASFNNFRTIDIIPLKLPEIIMPCGQTQRITRTENLKNLLQAKNIKDLNKPFAAFLHDVKRDTTISIGVMVNLQEFENGNEYSIKSTTSDNRVLLIDPANCKFDGEIHQAKEIEDEKSSYENVDNDFTKNLINDINKVIFAFYEITSKQFLVDNNLIRDLNSALVFLQTVLKQNMDFITASNKNSDKPMKFNEIIFKNIQEFSKLHMTIKKYHSFGDITNFLTCQDPVLRAKMLINFIYDTGDYIIKELYMMDEYKKDSIQKNEKYMLKFIKKQVEKLSGVESAEEYKKKLDTLEVNEQTKRAISLEIEQAFSAQTNDLYEYEDRKKYMILDDIFSFPWYILCN
jgi:hypothetical protein